jgi:hypothetical protein
LLEVEKTNLRLITNDEYCTPIVGQLIDTLELPGYGKENYIKFIDKIIMKDSLNANGIRTPYHRLFDKEKFKRDSNQYTEEIESTFSYPFILKPTSLYGAKDFNKIHHKKEWLTYAEIATNYHYDFQVEEFITGTLFHCDAIIKNSHIIFNSISEYIWPIVLFKQGHPTGSIWLSESDSRWNPLNEFHTQVIAALQPPDGATHCEVFLRQTMKSYFWKLQQGLLVH